MKLYWQERRSGQRLVLALDDDTETEVGAVRQTRRGFDALAMTNTYDPGRAQKGFASIEEAKAFVEEFHPWDLFGGDMDLEVDPEVRRLPGDASPPASDGVEQPSAAETPVETVEEAKTSAPAQSCERATPAGPGRGAVQRTRMAVLEKGLGFARPSRGAKAKRGGGQRYHYSRHTPRISRSGKMTSHW